LEDLLKALYGSFSSSPKHHLEFTKLVKIIETKKLNFFKNVKTRWIIMFQTLNYVGKEYKTLIVKMIVDYSSMESAKAQVKYNLILLSINQSIKTSHTQMHPLVDT